MKLQQAPFKQTGPVAWITWGQGLKLASSFKSGISRHDKSQKGSKQETSPWDCTYEAEAKIASMTYSHYIFWGIIHKDNYNVKTQL